jgi:hypothetical protein
MARSRKVAFNEDAANRIVRATLAYERGNRDQSPIRFRMPGDELLGLRIARTTEESDHGGRPWVEYVYRSSCEDEGSGSGTPEVGVTGENAWNLLYRIASGVDVIIGQVENGCWYIIAAANPEGSSGCTTPAIAGELLTALDGYDDTTVQILGHEQGCLKWINTTDCDQGSGSGS